MAKWDIHGRVVGSIFLGSVEAATREEAIEKAWTLPNCCVSLCHQCARQCEDAEIDKITAHETT